MRDLDHADFHGKGLDDSIPSFTFCCHQMSRQLFSFEFRCPVHCKRLESSFDLRTVTRFTAFSVGASVEKRTESYFG